MKVPVSFCLFEFIMAVLTVLMGPDVLTNEDFLTSHSHPKIVSYNQQKYTFFIILFFLIWFFWVFEIMKN